MVQALVVCFDAMDRDVARQLMDEGRMPNLARLRAEGLTAAMANPIGMLTAPVWPTLATGVHPSRHGSIGWRILQPGTYRMEWVGDHHRPAVPPFWDRLAEQGHTATVIDVPSVGVVDHANLVQIYDWILHDRRSPVAGAPADVVAEVAARFAPEGIDRCDDQGAAGDLTELRDALEHDLRRYTDGLCWLVEERPTDVVLAVFGSSHCAGHQFWHLHDRDSARHDAALARDLGDPLAEVYEQLDAALGRLLAVADPGVVTAVVLSHGMGENVTMPHLIDPLARALDEAMGAPPRIHWLREALRRAPNRISRLVRRSLGRPFEHLAYIADGSRRWFPIENFPTHGALRLNIVGREPNGRIEAADVADTIDHLERELLALRDADTGEPVVDSVIRVADHYEDVDHTPMADVLIEWHPARLVEAVTSPTIGTIRQRFLGTRAGAHHRDGLVVLHGSGVPAGIETELRSVDVWPTLAALLGVEPGDVDGVALPAVRLTSADG